VKLNFAYDTSERALEYHLIHSVTKGFAVSVDTTHGVVILKGALANQDAISDVKHIAEKVDGVKSVDTSTLIVAEK
jgi:hyperosmotically inducible protein